MDTVTLFNLALSSCGTRAAVSSPNENSREAEICRTWYPIVRDHILRAAPWPSTRAEKRLAVLAERDFDLQWTSTDPSPTFTYAYSVPADMLAPRHLTDYSRFILGVHNGTTSAIMTNSEDAILVYTRRQTDPNMWDTQLQLAIAFGLGSFICKPLNGKVSTANAMREEANGLINSARVSAANTDFVAQESSPDWLAKRGSAYDAPSTRYIYPLGTMLIEQGATDA